jgi:hypothetical protein
MESVVDNYRDQLEMWTTVPVSAGRLRGNHGKKFATGGKLAEIRSGHHRNKSPEQEKVQPAVVFRY